MPNASSKPASAVAQPAGEGVKGTLESIIVAFILAFVFRAFIVEAFVIPTGSMAPTLYGVHGMQTCQDCGTAYAYGLKEDAPIDNHRRKCPNCDKIDDQPPMTARSRQSGDRILVLKWPFDIGGQWFGPKRWDVVVFKDPADGVTNFIKRLIGLPGEVLEIIDGDIYTVSVAEIEAKDPELLEKLNRRRHLEAEYGRLGTEGKYTDQARVREELSGLGRQIKRGLDPLLTLRRKSSTRVGRRAQGSLWLPVHNQDFSPHRIRNNARPPRWTPASADSAWEASTPVVTFNGADRDTEALVFQPPGGFIRDRYAYNDTLPSPGDRYPVGDVRVRAFLTVHDGDGYIRFTLNKSPDRFVATLHSSGRLTLEHQDLRDLSTEAEPEVQIDPLVSQGPVQVEFSHLDGRVSLRIDGDEVLAKEYDPLLSLSALRSRRITGDSTRAQIAIVASRLDLTLRHLTLDRDVYYQPAVIRGDGRNRNPWANRAGWGSSGHPIHLREKEYFMLGDNSPQSADSRLWGTIGDHLVSRGDDYQPGTVPEDQLIGRAFFVYWPSGLRLFPVARELPFPWNVRIIPNVGDMRWIH